MLNCNSYFHPEQLQEIESFQVNSSCLNCYDDNKRNHALKGGLTKSDSNAHVGNKPLISDSVSHLQMILYEISFLLEWP